MNKSSWTKLDASSDDYSPEYNRRRATRNMRLKLKKTKRCIMGSRFLMKFGVSVITAMMVMAISASGYSADTEKIRLASEYPDKHPTVKNAFMPWIKEVSDKTDGNLKIQFFNPNTLAPAKEANGALMSGAADMIFTPSQMSARGKFPMSSVALLPFMTKSSTHAQTGCGSLRGDCR